MEAFAGNFVYRTSLNLQRRFFLIPCMMRNRGICSSSEGKKNPSFPVRYVPKTSTKTEKSQTRSIPMKGSDKKLIKKDLHPNSMKSVLLNKRMVAENNCALDIKPQSLYQGIADKLINHSYQGTMENELEEVAEKLEIQPRKFPLTRELHAYKDKNDTDDATIRLDTTSDKASDSLKPVQYVTKVSIKPEISQIKPTPVKSSDSKVTKKNMDPNFAKIEVTDGRIASRNTFSEISQIKPTPVKSSDSKVTKKNMDPNFAKIEVTDGRIASRNTFSDKKLQNLNEGPASSLPPFCQEVTNEINFDEETMNDEYMEEFKENDKELGNYSLSEDLRACENKEEAEKAAIRLLGSRAYTAVELRKKLHGKKFPASTIDAVITDFQSRGLINDCLYAESYARSRWSSSSWGPRRVKQALRKKGVTEVDSEEALKLVYEEGDQELSLGLSKVSMDHLYTQALKQWLRGQDISDETRKSRIIRWLQYRGFNWGVTSFILKKLESKHTP